MYPNVIKFRDYFTPIAAIIAVIFTLLFSYVLIQTYTENGKSVLALTCVILLHFIIVPVGLLFTVMVFNPPVSTLTPDGVEVKIFPRTHFYKWSDIEGDLKISYMRGVILPKAFGFHFIVFGQFHNEVYLMPINFFSKRSKVLEVVKLYRAAALQKKRTCVGVSGRPKN